MKTRNFLKTILTGLAMGMALGASNFSVQAQVFVTYVNVGQDYFSAYGQDGAGFKWQLTDTWFEYYPYRYNPFPRDDSFGAFPPGASDSTVWPAPGGAPLTGTVSFSFASGSFGPVTVFNYGDFLLVPLWHTPPINPGDNNDSPPCHGDCCGMPVWSVSEPYISLWLRDEPLGYQPALGPRVSFTQYYKQRDTVSGYNPNIFSLGKKWNFDWCSYVTQDAYHNPVVHFANGRQRTFYTPADYITNTRLAGSTNAGFALSYPDGSQDVYGLVVTNSNGAFQEAFLTANVNPAGQQITYLYDAYDPANPVVRLRYVVDGDGRTNVVGYVSNNSYSTNLISYVVDPFGRTNFLAYDGSGHLTNSVDAAGNPSSYAYDGNDWVTSMTTPYGTTSFAITDTPAGNTAPNGRSILVTKPDGGHELYLNADNAAGVAAAYATNQIPVTAPFANLFDTNNLNLHNSFHWGPRQYANLSTTSVSGFTANDFCKARLKHWLGSYFYSVGNTLSMERDPSPDNAGTMEGQKVWYDYYNKGANNYEGTQIQPLLVARVLPDGTTAFTRTLRNYYGAVTNEVSTYSAGASVGLRTNVYVYDSNGIDLLMATNASGVQVLSNRYNAFHQVLTSFNALGELTTYTYDANQRVSSVTRPNGLVITNLYGSDGFLAQQIVVGFATNSYSYAKDLVLTHTDARGLVTTNTWDNLNRLTSTVYPDGSYSSNCFTYLDVTASRDRDGNWSYYGYDSLRRKVAETNANGAVTRYNYCVCGLLDSTVDAASQTTVFSYDNQGNLTNALYPDGYSITRSYDLLRRVVATTDSGGTSVTNWYNNQSLKVAVTSALGEVQSFAYDVLDRVTNAVDANAVAVNTTYDNLNRVSSRRYPDGGVEFWGYTANVPAATSHTNQIGNVVLYAYDGLGRATNEVHVGVNTNQFAYSGAGDLLTLTDGNNHATAWGYDAYGRVTNKVDAANNPVFHYAYDPAGRLTNRWSAAKGNTKYAYDAVGNLTQVTYPVSPAITLGYDLLNRLTNMVDAVGSTAYGYDAASQLLSEDGPWAGDTVSYAYQNRLRAGLMVQMPSGSAWTQSYGYDVARRLTGITSPAGTFGYSYDPVALLRVDQVTLPNGASITNSYDGNARLTGTWLINSLGADLDSYVYTYNQANQRTRVARAAGDYVNYTYDNIGEVLIAEGREASGTYRNNDRSYYTYDPAGNMLQKRNASLSTQINYRYNPLNEIVSNIFGLNSGGWSGAIAVAGATTRAATNVTVNGKTANLYADNTFFSIYGTTAGINTLTAVAQDVYGRSSTSVSVVNVIPTNTAYVYDLNGNLLTDGTRNFAYDDENQLTSVWQTNGWRNDFAYDGKLRRRIERDYTWSNSVWTLTNEIHFIYDGNLVIQERDTNNVAQVTYTRGTDLSGRLQGAGGIGGLLARTDRAQAVPVVGQNGSQFGYDSYYHADGNGNVTMLISAGQMVVAKYLYDPFGNTVAASGWLADINKYRFSSKEWNANAGLYYYLYRFYDPNLQRWLNHDPIGEAGGLNLYSFVRNRPTLTVDSFGLFDMTAGTPSISISDNSISIVQYTYGKLGAWNENASPAGSVDFFKGALLNWTGCKCKMMKLYERFDSIYRHRDREVLDQTMTITVSEPLNQAEAEKIMATWALAGDAVGFEAPSIFDATLTLLKKDNYEFQTSSPVVSQYYQPEDKTFWRLTGSRTETEDIDLPESRCHGWLLGPFEPGFLYENPFE